MQSESFRDLLLRYRGRSGLTQRQLAERLGVHRRSVQEWENGATYPNPERLEMLVQVLLERDALTPREESLEAAALWAAARREAPRIRAPFDDGWFARLLAEREGPAPTSIPGPGRPGWVEQERQASQPAVPRLGGASVSLTPRRLEDWGDAPDRTGFVGRTAELATLSRWVLDERCRLVAVLGMGGIGKTSLTAALASEVAPDFERVYWRSLRDAPPPHEWLADALRFLSDQQLAPPADDSQARLALLQLLRDRRCLLVLDNAESVIEPGAQEGRYRAGLEGYGFVLQAVGDAPHQSCLLLTSREAPPDLTALSGDAVRIHRLGGLAPEEVRALLATKQLRATPEQWTVLSDRFGGNSLALKIVGESIRELFDSQIGAFLDESPVGVFGGVRRLLDEQVERSSSLEWGVLRALSVEREPVVLPELLSGFGPRVARAEVLQAIDALRRRSLIERAEVPGRPAFTLQSVVLEYVTDRLVHEAAAEIRQSEPALLVEQPLMKARAREYVRQTQERLIGAPILEQFMANSDAVSIDRKLILLLDGWRGRARDQQGYGPGNVVNLLRLSRGHLRGLDLSRLSIRQAYLADVEAQNATLAGARLDETVMAEAFDFPGSVALSSDGTILAVGTTTGQVWLWHVADRTPLQVVQGHTGAVWGVALSADGRVVASSSSDGMVRLWETASGTSLGVLAGHTGMVRSVALSSDGGLLASGGTDGTVRLWRATSAEGVEEWLSSFTLSGPVGGVKLLVLSANGSVLSCVGTDGLVRTWNTTSGERMPDPQPRDIPTRTAAISADGQVLATGEAGGRVCLWDTSSGRLLATTEAMNDRVWALATSADGRLLATSGQESAILLWDTSGAGSSAPEIRPVGTMEPVGGGVWGLSMSADGSLLASGSADGAVRLWDTGSTRPLASFQGHTRTFSGVAISADASLVATGGTDMRLWDGRTGQLLTVLREHGRDFPCVALSADGRVLAGGGPAGSPIRVRDATIGQPLTTLPGGDYGNRSVALSGDGQLAASGAEDGSIRVWDTRTARPLATLQGHTGEVRSVALSAEGRLLASGSSDGTVRLWDTQTLAPLATLRNHAGEVWGVALSPDGRLLASGGADRSVHVWEVPAGLDRAEWRPLATLHGRLGGIWGLALSAGGRLLAIGDNEGTLQLWDTILQQELATVQAHSGGIWTVAVSADARVVVTASLDGTARMWDGNTGECLRTLRPERRYEGMDVTDLEGITPAQRVALLALGAVEHA